METVNTFRMSSSIASTLSASMTVLAYKVSELENKVKKSQNQLFFSPLEAAQFVESMVDDSKALDTELQALLGVYNQCAQVLMPYMTPTPQKAPTAAQEVTKTVDLLSVPEFLAKQPGNLVTAKNFSSRIRHTGIAPCRLSQLSQRWARGLVA